MTKRGSLVHLRHHFVFIPNKVSSINGHFVVVFNKTVIEVIVGYEMTDYSQLITVHLVGYLPSHIQGALVE